MLCQNSLLQNFYSNKCKKERLKCTETGRMCDRRSTVTPECDRKSLKSSQTLLTTITSVRDLTLPATPATTLFSYSQLSKTRAALCQRTQRTILIPSSVYFSFSFVCSLNIPPSFQLWAMTLVYVFPQKFKWAIEAKFVLEKEKQSCCQNLSVWSWNWLKKKNIPVFKATVRTF